MSRRLTPAHMVLCPEDEDIFVETETNEGRCHKHPAARPVDMGYRVGESAANYTWYSTLERAWTDRRCKA